MILLTCVVVLLFYMYVYAYFAGQVEVFRDIFPPGGYARHVRLVRRSAQVLKSSCSSSVEVAEGGFDVKYI